MSYMQGLYCLSPVKIKLDEKCYTKDLIGALHYDNVILEVPCGRCLNCKMRRSREWCLRLEMESSYYDDIAFVTLTYNDDNLYYRFYDDNREEVYQGRKDDCKVDFAFCVPTLFGRDMQLYIKRVRKYASSQIRYYGVGEYGTRYGRPHYHLLVFGVKPDDYHLLRDEWHYGFVDIRPFFKETCTYVAGYIQKKLYGKDKDEYREPELMRCSKGIGLRWLIDHYKEIDPDNPVIYVNGYPHAVPRYFKSKLVDMGYLPELSVYDYFAEQILQIDDFNRRLAKLDVSRETYLKNRFKIANQKIKKLGAKRQETGDI